MEKNVFQMFPVHLALPCDTHSCRGQKAAYFLGKPEDPVGTLTKVCEKCAGELVESLTIEAVAKASAELKETSLLPFEPPEPDYIEVLEIDGKPITEMTVKELKAACKSLGLKGYSDKKEDELIAMIEEASNELAVEHFEGEI